MQETALDRTINHGGISSLYASNLGIVHIFHQHLNTAPLKRGQLGDRLIKADAFLLANQFLLNWITLSGAHSRLIFIKGKSASVISSPFPESILLTTDITQRLVHLIIDRNIMGLTEVVFYFDCFHCQ